MWASVNWSPIQFVRQLPWLALEPPKPEYGISIMPPLNEGGWWLMAGFFLTLSLLLWWARMYRRARDLGLGSRIRLGLSPRRSGSTCARIHPTAAHGPFQRSRAIRHLPASRLDRGIFPPLRQPFLQSVPHALDRVPLWIRSAVRDARRAPSSPSAGMAASARSSRCSIAEPPRNAPRSSGDGRWASTPR